MSVTAGMRVFVDEQAVDVPEGASVRYAVAVLDVALADALDGRTAYATDGVGRAIAPDAPVTAGAIIRVVRAAPRTEDA